MADRTIVARLRAEVAQFLSGMGKASKATAQVGDEAEKSSRKADGAFSRMAKSVQTNSAHIDRLGKTALIAGGAITAGLGYGVKAFADFDQAMSAVNAALPEAGAKMEDLRKLAIDLGKDSQFSATEAAQGITELGKAGVSTEAILGGGLKGALDLAAAGSLAVSDAAEIAASAMTQFGLSGEQVPHIADLLAAGAGKAQGSVSDLGMALNQAGLVANATGLSIEETTAGLSAFASAGLVGSDAGTSFKSMLQRLTPQSAEAQAQFDALGISAYDAQGNFVGLADFAGQLQTKMANLTPEARNAALSVMFGSDAVRAANVLYEQGATGINKWTAEVNDAGFAAKQAAALTDNLKGDLERLGGAIDSVFVQNGEGANGALRSMTQLLEDMVEGFGNLPQPAQQTALGLTAVTGAGLLAAGAFAKAVTTGADLLDSLSQLRASGPKAAKGVDLATKAAKGFAVAMAAAAAIAVASRLGGENTLGIDTLTKGLLEGTDAVAAFDAQVAKLQETSSQLTNQDVSSFGDVIKNTFDPGTFAQVDHAIQSFGAMFGILDSSAVTRSAEQLSALDQSLTGLVSGGHADEAARVFEQFAAAAAEQGISVDELKRKFPGYVEALASANTQQVLGTDSAGTMAGALQDVGDAAATGEEKVADLADAIRGFGDLAISADEAESRFQEAIDRVTESVKENGKAHKDTNEAGRNNLDALRELATAAIENSAATLELTGSTDDATAAMKTGREAFIKAATQIGLTKTEAKKLADQYGLIPKNVDTTVNAHTAKARTAVQQFQSLLNGLHDKDVNITVRYNVGRLPSGGLDLTGGVTKDADGGMHVRSGAGLVKAYADGGTWDGSIGAAQPRIARAGGRGILWSEEGAGPWEAFISGHPAKRQRSRIIAQDTVERLGGRIQWARPFADGALLTRSDLGLVGGSETNDNRIFIDKVIGPSLDEIERKAAARRRRDQLSPSRQGSA